MGGAVWARPPMVAVRRAGMSVGVAALFVPHVRDQSCGSVGIDLSMAGIPRRGARCDQSPRAANPLCWTTISSSAIGRAGSNAAARNDRGVRADVRLVGAAWAPADTQSLRACDGVAAANCWVNAWLRFGRAPYMRGRADRGLSVRGGGGGKLFEYADRRGEEGCPPNIPPWIPPREDLLLAP